MSGSRCKGDGTFQPEATKRADGVEGQDLKHGLVQHAPDSPPTGPPLRIHPRCFKTTPPGCPHTSVLLWDGNHIYEFVLCYFIRG